MDVFFFGFWFKNDVEKVFGDKMGVVVYLIIDFGNGEK